MALPMTANPAEPAAPLVGVVAGTLLSRSALLRPGRFSCLRSLHIDVPLSNPDLSVNRQDRDSHWNLTGLITECRLLQS
jgi:hypothetical protein